jgi:hypothetical protein
MLIGGGSFVRGQEFHAILQSCAWNAEQLFTLVLSGVA